MKFQIRRNASEVVHLCQGLSWSGFYYDAESVLWLDGFINDVRTRTDLEEDPEPLVPLFGAYLGEAIIQNFGGEWGVDERGCVV